MQVWPFPGMVEAQNMQAKLDPALPEASYAGLGPSWLPLTYCKHFFTLLCLLLQSNDCPNLREFEDIAPNTVNMALQIPQYFLLTCGEVVFSVTGLEFSYSQVSLTLLFLPFPAFKAAWPGGGHLIHCSKF